MTLLMPPPAELRAVSYDNHIKKQQEKALRKKIEKRRNRVEDRIKQRSAVYRDGGPAVYDEGSILSKLTRQGDYDGSTLVGEILATLLMHFFQSLFATQYLIQQREFSEAQQLDRAKEQRIANREATDDHIRLAYEPLRDPSTNFQTLLLDAAGNPIYPKIYPITNGQVDYHRDPITDGTASRYAIRMNGFVPVENFAESYEIQMLKLSEDFSGSSSFTNRQKAMLHKIAEEAGRREGKKSKKDDAVSAREAMRRPTGPAPTGRR